MRWIPSAHKTPSAAPSGTLGGGAFADCVPLLRCCGLHRLKTQFSAADGVLGADFSVQPNFTVITLFYT